MTDKFESAYVPLNNLDEPYPDGQTLHTPEELLDQVPYEPTIDELYAGATAEELRQLGYRSFYSGLVTQLDSAATIDQRISTAKKVMTKEELVLQALGLAIKHVRENHAGNRDGIQLTDRVQNAASYLCAAATNHNPAKNRSLFGYAQTHLDTHILRYERGQSTQISHGDLIRVPRKESRYHAVKRFRGARESILGYPVEPAEILQCSTFTQEDVNAYDKRRITHEPFDMEDEHTLLAAGASPDPADIYCSNDVSGALGLLPDGQRGMLIARLGLNGENSKTTEEIAEEFNVSVRWARNNTSAALRKLREIPDILQIILGEKDPGDVKSAETRNVTPVIQLRPKHPRVGDLAEAS